MDGFYSLVTIAIATWQAVEIWHHGGIFANPRSWLEEQFGWIPELLMCPFCLSVNVAFWLWVWWLLAGSFLTGGWIVLARLPIIALAASRIANICNDLTYKVGRTPGRKGEAVNIYEDDDEDL